ncbi:unnamed protein product [Vicia faba]|uniref:Uncharacterized protein n=1 Tax=Vicia faba TaxID=3906 RepID=A0AAV1AH94_VICFA|nr:unnamed protein product [Vicia faba]
MKMKELGIWRMGELVQGCGLGKSLDRSLMEIFWVQQPYIQWIKERNKDRRWPFAIEKPLYPQEPDQPDDVLNRDYELLQAQNQRLLEERETMEVKCLVATQEKTKLAHILKRFKGEMPSVAKKRSRSEHNHVSVENHWKIVAEIEKKYKQKCRDCEILKAFKADLEKRSAATTDEVNGTLNPPLGDAGNLVGAIVNNHAANPSGQNLNGNAGVNLGNGSAVNLGTLAGNNQGIPVI